MKLFVVSLIVYNIAGILQSNLSEHLQFQGLRFSLECDTPKEK